MQIRIFFFSLLLVFSDVTLAKKLVLIQGYLGQPSSWSDSGIAQMLDVNGWSYAGEFVYSSSGARLISRSTAPEKGNSANKFYRVSLPTEASIQSQSYILSAYLKRLRQLYPDEEIILAGHSAGGVVARNVMVRNPELKVSMLISIASPHLGTDSAEFGRLLGNSPLAMIAPMIGANTLNRSQSLYNDLLPEMPHRFLYWLNRQPHPEAEYISIVRDDASSSGGDFVVPSSSQYLENVYNLRYRAKSYIVPGSHALTPADGRLLIDLLNVKSFSGGLHGFQQHILAITS